MRLTALTLLCAVMILSDISPAQAQTGQTLVSNFEQSQDVMVLRQQGAYQAFTTGDNAPGYVLSSVEVYFTSASASASHITASLYEMRSGELHTKVTDLTNPGSITFGSNIFSAPEGIGLSAGTSYAVVFSITGDWRLGGTYSTTEDADSRSGWAIEDTYYNLVGSEYIAPLGRFSMMIRVNGIATSLDTVSIAPPTLAAGAGGHLFEIEGDPDSAENVPGGAWVLTRTGDGDGELTVNLTVSESGGNFVRAGNEGTQTVTFADGETTAHYRPVEDDSTKEDNGTVTVELASGDGYDIDSANNRAAVAVRDDDKRMEFAIDPLDLTVVEGEDAQFHAVIRTIDTGTFTEIGDVARVLRARSGFWRGRTISYVLSWVSSRVEAKHRTDYAPFSIRISIAASDFAADGDGGYVARKPLQLVQVLADNEVEGPERLTVALEYTGGTNWGVAIPASRENIPDLLDNGNVIELSGSNFIAAVLTITDPPPSDDATLSGLTLTETGTGNVIELDPQFASNELEYAAQVPTGVQTITLEATANHSAATLEYMNGKEGMLEDMDPDTEAVQVGLMVGENPLKVQVEAENGMKQIYTVSVTRQGPPLTLALDTIVGDDVVNIREKVGGFAVGGTAVSDRMGSMEGTSVRVDIGSGTLTATTDSAGEWSVNVPPDADYISEPSVIVTLNASGPHLSEAEELTRTLTVDLTPPEPVSAVVDGDALTLTFDEILAERVVSPDAFTVSVNGEVQSGTIAVTVGGSTVVLALTLPSAVSAGDSVTLGYAIPDGSDLNPIRDTSGNEAEPLNDHPVENATPPGERCAGSEGSIRLMDGSDEKEGRVEVCADDDTGDNTSASWGTVCDDYWTNVDADVACRALGYEQSEPVAGRFLRSRFGAGPGPIWLDDLLCDGDESNLLDCPLAGGRRARDAIGVHNCKSGEIVGVRCMAADDEKTLSVTDATVEEGAQLAFRVLLNEAADWEVSVRYRTRSGSATPGTDYEDVSGTLTFATGETEKTVTVVTLDDSVDDDGETLTLRLHFAFGANIEDGEATGTIHNSDPLPKAWLTRFGRTSASHVVAMLDSRFDEAAVTDNRLTLGGHAMSLGTKREQNTGLPEQVADLSPSPENQTREATPLEHALWTLLTNNDGQIETRRFISQTSFDLSLSSLSTAFAEAGVPALRSSPAYSTRRQESGDESSIETLSAMPDTAGNWSLWGRGALTHFGGADDGVDIDGDVLTGLLGVDYARNRWLAGVALAYHDGDGSYRSARSGDTGELDSRLVSVNPYLRYALTDRLSVWGTLGYGAGTLSLRPGYDSVPGEAIETDMSMGMGAVGLRGVVYASASNELALKTDALWVRTDSDELAGMQAVDGADTSRMRLLLSGRHQRVLANDALLTPGFELGLRYDNGDAETGFGMELGGRLRYADPVRGLTMEARARALLAHEDGSYEEWGIGGSLSLDPGRLGRGLALRLDSAWGQARSGAEALWQRQTTAGIAPQHDTAARGRLSVELGYGMDVPWSHGILTPYSGVELAGNNSTLRLGWRYTLGQALSLSLDGERREDGQTPPEHVLMLRTSMPW